MKFLRYFVLGTLILQTFGLTAMNPRQKSELIRQITQSFAKEASWFGDSKNVEELKALINKLGTVERGSKDNYLTVLNIKIATAQALKKSSSNSAQSTSVEIKARQESYTPSPKITGVATVACTQTKQENAQTPSTTTPAKETFITYSDAIRKVKKIVPQSTTHNNALAALSTLAQQGNEPTVKFDATTKIIYIQESAVDAIIAKHAPSKTKQPQEKQSGSDKAPSQPIKQSIQSTQPKPLITFADAKRKITEIIDAKHQELALQDLAKILIERGIKGEDSLRRITEPDLSSIIEKYLNSGDTSTTVETKQTKEKQSYSGQSSSADLVSSAEALTMLKQAVAKANLKDSKKVQEEAIADLNEISKGERALKKANITYFYRSDIEETINVFVGIAQYKEQRDKEVEETLKKAQENKDEKKFREIQNISNEGIAAGTVVKTPHGLIAVEKLRVGDHVNSWDLSKSEITKSKILNIAKRKIPSVIQLTLRHMGTSTKKTVTVAPEHWFLTDAAWLINDTWKQAKKLKIDDMVNDYYVHAIEEKKIETEVYNLHLENIHNFIVSEAQVVVHNMVHTLTFMPLIFGGEIKLAAIVATAAISIGIIFFWELICKFAKKVQQIITGNNNNSGGGQSGTPDPDDDRPRDWQKLTNKMAREIAKKLGYEETTNVDFNPRGQLVFKKGNKYISPDVDGHKGGVWKMVTKSGKRLGTYADQYLTKLVGE